MSSLAILFWGLCCLAAGAPFLQVCKKRVLKEKAKRVAAEEALVQAPG